MDPRSSRRVHATFVALAVALCTLYATGEGVASNAAVVLASLLPAAVVVHRLARGQAGARTSWWWLLAGLAAFTVHNVQSLVVEAVLGLPAATGALAMITQVLGYLGLLIGATLLTMPFARRDAGGMIDASIIGVACASVVWIAVLHPAAAARDTAGGEQLYRLITVLLVSALAGAVLRAGVVAREARWALGYQLVAVTAAYVGIVAGALTKDLETGAEVWWVRLCWIVAYLALGAGAVHPSFSHLTVGAGQDSGRLTLARLGFLGVALVLNPLLAGVQQVAGLNPDALLLSVGSLLLVPLVLARIAGLARLHAQAEQRLARLATLDELTGLPNRRGLTQRLVEDVAKVAAGSCPGVVVIFLDLDDFKEVNDTHGHQVGDLLLVAVAGRLRRAVRAGDLVGRFGGDEFVVILQGEPDVVVPRVTASVEDALSRPVQLDEVAASAVASLGVASARAGDRVSAEHLLSTADAAMYVSKRARASVG